MNHLHRDLARIKKQLLAMGSRVESAIHDAITSLVTRRAALAEKVIEGDRRVDELEVELEEKCLKVLALHQPVAGDLRFLISVLKVNNELERIGYIKTNCKND